MRLDCVRPQSVHVSLHPLELAGLVTAARWVLDGLRETPPPEALEQLRQILADYDRQAAGLAIRPRPRVIAAGRAAGNGAATDPGDANEA
jgi:hypothetical protein